MGVKDRKLTVFDYISGPWASPGAGRMPTVQGTSGTTDSQVTKTKLETSKRLVGSGLLFFCPGVLNTPFEARAGAPDRSFVVSKHNTGVCEINEP